LNIRYDGFMEKLKQVIAPSLFMLVMMVSIGPFGDTEYTPSLPRIAHDMMVPYSMVQLTMTSYLLGYAISQLLYGPISDRFGRRPVMLVGAAIFVLGSLACFMSDHIGTLIAGRFVQAIGSCAGGVISSAAVRDAFPPEKRGHVFAKVNAAFALAPALGPIVGSLVDHLYGWHANFLILLVMSALLLILVFFRFHETHFDLHKDAIKPKIMAKNFAELLKDPYYLAYVLTMGFSLGIVYSALIGAPDLVINVLHMTSAVIIVIAAGVLFGFVLGSLICNLLQGPMSDQALILTGLFIMLIGSLWLAVIAYIGLMSAGLIWSLIPIAVIFMGIAFVMPIAQAKALEPFEKLTGSASAMLGFVQMGLASLSTGIMSMIHRTAVFSMPFVFTLLTILAMISFIALVWLRPGRVRLVA
jgi:MFS transporter, DHA1 family, multidrug resistance protein